MCSDYCDIITKLGQKHLNHVIENIFSYFYMETVKQTETISTSWSMIIGQSNVWKNVFTKYILCDGIWCKMLTALKNDKNYPNCLNNQSLKDYRQTCLLIEDGIKLLKENWKSVTFKETELLIGEADCKDIIDIGHKWIVHATDNDSDVEVHNRWNRSDPTDVLELPIDKIEERGYSHCISSLKVNNYYIVASLEGHPDIFIWDATSKLLITILDNEVGPEEDDNDEEEEEKWRPKHFVSLFEHCIFSYRSRVCDSDIVTFWKDLNLLPGEEPVPAYRKEIEDDSNVWDIAMDNSFVIVFYGDSDYSVDIHSTASFELLHKITIEEYYTNHYLNGLIVTATENPKDSSRMRLWDAKSGTCLSAMAFSDFPQCLRIVSNSFLVSCDKYGKLSLYDLIGALESKEESRHDYLMKTSAVLPSGEGRGFVRENEMVADEFQIVLTAIDEEGMSYLRIIDFLGKPDDIVADPEVMEVVQ